MTPWGTPILSGWGLARELPIDRERDPRERGVVVDVVARELAREQGHGVRAVRRVDDADVVAQPAVRAGLVRDHGPLRKEPADPRRRLAPLHQLPDRRAGLVVEGP